ncbi:MAG: restriction endonuclease subunit S, partial [Chloroflexi bacterium]|nr:restriction endonuclease subunit S [Chloroflexota bacterium]
RPDFSTAPKLPDFLNSASATVAHIESLAARVNEAQRLREEADVESELLFASYLKATRHQLLENGFPKSKIGDVAVVTSGGTPSRDNPTYWGGDIPWIKTGELIDGDIYDSEEHITEEGMKNSSARLFPPETILIALYGQGQTRGRTARLMIEATTNQACCAILPTPEILDSRFTQYWQRSLYYEMREKSHGGAQPNWNGGMIKNIEIALPPLDEQRRIVAYLDGLQAKVNALRGLQSASGEELSALMSSVLDRAFKGEI